MRFVFTYRPPAGGSRTRLKIDDYGAITLDQARSIAGDLRGWVAAGLDAYDAKRFGIQMPEEVAMTVQDRAYTSPIWYTP